MHGRRGTGREERRGPLSSHDPSRGGSLREVLLGRADALGALLVRGGLEPGRSTPSLLSGAGLVLPSVERG
jgi:hypothetical protein